jgi:hypothetical protein
VNCNNFIPNVIVQQAYWSSAKFVCFIISVSLPSFLHVNSVPLLPIFHFSVYLLLLPPFSLLFVHLIVIPLRFLAVTEDRIFPRIIAMSEIVYIFLIF